MGPEQEQLSKERERKEKKKLTLLFAAAESGMSAPLARPGALPVRMPSGSTRSFRNQLVRLDLCSFVSSSVHPFCNLLMLGTEQNDRFGSAVAAAVSAADAVAASSDGPIDLKASELYFFKKKMLLPFFALWSFCL